MQNNKQPSLMALCEVNFSGGSNSDCHAHQPSLDWVDRIGDRGCTLAAARAREISSIAHRHIWTAFLDRLSLGDVARARGPRQHGWGWCSVRTTPPCVPSVRRNLSEVGDGEVLMPVPRTTWSALPLPWMWDYIDRSAAPWMRTLSPGFTQRGPLASRLQSSSEGGLGDIPARWIGTPGVAVALAPIDHRGRTLQEGGEVLVRRVHLPFEGFETKRKSVVWHD